MALKEEIISTISQPTSGIAFPRFDLEEDSDGAVTGFVISDSFAAKPQMERQDLVWNVLENNLPADHLAKLVMLITVTPEEDAKE
jgi:acid stress-induced BolA-like protein IbaG/YrbA